MIPAETIERPLCVGIMRRDCASKAEGEMLHLGESRESAFIALLDGWQ